MKIKKYIKYVKHPYKLFKVLAFKGFFKNMDDEKYIKRMYKSRMGKDINLENPKTFNEKINWLKLYDRKEIYTKMVDKYEVKKYVANVIGNEYIIPTIGIYDNWNEINFKDLPSKFVIKCTHDSGGLVIVKEKNKINYKESKNKIEKSLKNNYYFLNREWPYKNVKPRILIEKYMVDESGYELKDYKFFCFNGKVQYVKVDFDRMKEHHANYYDRLFRLQPFGEASCPPKVNKKIEKPKDYKEMIEIAEKLAQGLKFIRVDLYNINGKIYFGELTFYPAGGFGKFIPEVWDEKMGSMIDLK